MKSMRRFEWDDAKAEANLKKHHISFEQAKAIWNDPFHYRLHLTDDPETRWLIVGRVQKDVFHSAIFTYRGRVVRIISARRSSALEVRAYYG